MSAPSQPTRLHIARLIDGSATVASGTPSGIPSGTPVEPGNTLPLILLHGFTGDTTTWDPLRPHLDPRRPTFAIDLVGHGRSDAPRDPAAYRMDATVAAILCAAAAAGIARAHWLGYSMGGRVALHLALAAPDRVASLILIGTSPGIPDPAARAARRRDDAALAELIETAGLPAFVDRWMANPLFATQARLGPAHLARARAQRLANHPHALAHTLRGMGTGTMEPAWDRLGEITAPVLLVAGAEDPKFIALAESMLPLLPRADLHIIPAAGHAVHSEAPAALAAALIAFLARADPPGQLPPLPNPM